MTQAVLSDARPMVDRLLADALARRASDVHIEPTPTGHDIRLRIDGLLQTVESVESTIGRGMVARLMVMARLLTYRLDVPQEGRISIDNADLRLAIMPTVHGLRAAIRMPADRLAAAILDELGLPANVSAGLKQFARSDGGMLILTGPAGSGKTTTIYALLAHLLQNQAGLSIVTLEDPVERHLPGITQIEVSPFGQLTYERALRSILRQDPQVLMIGEIRDAATASLAVQAALSGHRLITTLHAGTAGGAIARLLEMGIEPYQLTSSIFGIVAQRLLRRRAAQGYAGRAPLAEWVVMDAAMREAILRRADAGTLRALYGKQPEFRAFAQIGQDCIDRGITDEAEVRRTLGCMDS